MRLFHGTTADNAKRILEQGFSVDTGGENWTVSGDAVYFWSPQALCAAGECEEDSAEYYAKNRAKDSAGFGIGKAKDARIVVFEVELDGTHKVEPDSSCKNMEGAVCTFEDVPASAIRRVWVSEDLSLLKGYFLAFLLNRDMCAHDLSHIEKKIAKAFAQADIYPEDEGLLELSEISLQDAENLLQ